MHAEPAGTGVTRAARLLLAAGVLAFGLAALGLGQSNNWDLRNYHWYAGWAWLEGRGHLDLAAAQAQSWFNPVLPALLYLLLSSLKPAIGTFVLGVVQGLNLLPLHRIARRLLPGHAGLALLAAFVGATGATQRGELGATFGDTLVSLPLLTALALLVTGEPTRRRSAAAGALLGVAVGLKLTAAPIAAGIALAACALFLRRGGAMRHGLALTGAAALLFLAVDGHWMWQLWRDFGNPLFPQFGTLFGGEFAPPMEFRDTRWLPRSATEWLFYPLVWADEPRRVSELWFLDLRVPLLFLAALALPLWLRPARARLAKPDALDTTLAACALAYLLWLALFGYYRYLVVLEMLAPVLLAAALLSVPRRSGIVVACSVLVIVGLATRAPRWGRLDAYADSFVTVQLPPLANRSGALVVFGDREPLAFLAPSFPAGTRFVRILGNVVGPPLPEWALDRAVRERIAAHRGPLLLLAARLDDAALGEALQRHGVAVDRATCEGIAGNLLTGDLVRPQLCTLTNARNRAR